MTRLRAFGGVLAAILVACAVPAGAQPRGLADVGGEVGLGLALRHLANTGIFLETTAHPDDENNGLLVMLNRGQGVRTALFTVTRGTGGQNEIGPELFESLAVLRTEELASVHAWDGAEQYFGRAIDFGYSFGTEETFRKWGREQILGDFVRIIRMIRPDVIIAMRPDGTGGGQHHQASAILTGEAFKLAADPTKYPEQIKAGLRPWQPRKLYFTEQYGFPGEPPATPGARLVAVNSEVYDPLLGQTYAYIGSEARSNHKCQGMGQLLALPGPQSVKYRLADTAIPGQASKDETTLFDAVDTSIAGLAQFVKGTAPEALRAGLGAVAVEVANAQKAFDSEGVAATRRPLAAGLTALRAVRSRLGSMGLDDTARFEIDYRLQTKEEEFQQALVLAEGLQVDVLADDGLVYPGQGIKTTTIVANRGTDAVQVRGVELAGVEGAAGCRSGDIAAGGIFRCESAVRIPANATFTTPYWHPLPDTARYEFDADAPFGAPFAPTPFRLRLQLVIDSVEVTLDRPVLYRYQGNIFSGEKRMQLLVVPRFSVNVSPSIAIVPLARAATPATPSKAAPAREIRVVVTNGEKGPAKGTVSLEVPAGWTASPSSIPIETSREDEAETVRFQVTPPPGAKPGEFKVRAVVTAAGSRYDEGYETIEYPHIHRRQRIVPAEATVKTIDVQVAPRLQVGYVMGVGDQVPPALEQLGAKVTQLSADDLAWGDLSRFDAIVTGVRAYERRADLRANNHRLIEYAERGGTLVVQYNKFEFNEAQYGPYPAKVSANRVTDENAPVTVLVPTDPVFTFPNKVTEATWKNWVQERGLYFLGEKDPRYVDLVQMADPFPFNEGNKKGALVEAPVGKGHWIYVGLGLWRQVTAGTDGAYQLLANLISRGRAGRAK